MKMDISRPSGTELRASGDISEGPTDDRYDRGFIGSLVRFAIGALLLGGAVYFVMKASLTAVLTVGGVLLLLFIILVVLMDLGLNDTPMGS